MGSRLELVNIGYYLHLLVLPVLDRIVVAGYVFLFLGAGCKFFLGGSRCNLRRVAASRVDCAFNLVTNLDGS